ncbi:amidohydrolase [Gracilibacillus sp. S3-1-1]|uniref:Amidohydrolase n=1 Tax=Gracilibacillus pellucidus TaxID=3095368 RepID=A0ACC6M9N4_9BACI|nr:amidohydrolase [Gracilibacillus sp. S3-1-1]MDX8047698.1 amidohydrolase [Gracilibacillus sp. S3-1-1]
MADIVFKNGSIYCVEPKGKWVEAVAIKAGFFIAVGTNKEIAEYITAHTEVVDLGGKTVIPSLHDMHTHALVGAYELLNTCNLPTSSFSTLANLLEAISNFATDNPEAEWISGGAWQPSIQNQLHKSQLDKIDANRPILLYDFSHHNAWVNSKALELAGINAETEDPKGGIIERDQSGEPTGVLLEGATQLVAKHITFYEKYDRAQAAKHIMEQFNQYGITSIKDALADKTVLETYNKLDKENHLHMRIAAYLPWKASVLGAETTEAEQVELINNRKQYQTELVKTDFVKMFIDGVPAAKTAVFYEGYQGEENYHYLEELLINPDTLQQAFIDYDKQGISVKVHATGDAAVSTVLDAIEATKVENGSTHMRHQIAHASFVQPKDYARFAQLNAIAEFSPLLWVPTITHEGNKLVLGEERADEGYPIKSVVATGATTVYGSDYPITPDPNPWHAMEGLITRKDPTGELPGTVNEEERIDIYTAIELFTINGAKSMYTEDVTGSIEVGKSADMIVLNQNIFEVDSSNIHQTEVLLTLFKGVKVHEKQE